MLPILNAILPVTVVSMIGICIWGISRDRVSLRFVGLFWTVGCALDIALHVGRILPKTRFGGEQNWEGKALQLFVVLIALFFVSRWIKPSQMGLTLQQNRETLRSSIFITVGFIAFVALMTWVVGLPKEPPSMEVIAWNMCVFPDFVEEIVFRALLLAILANVFPRQREWLGIPFGIAVVMICLLFGLEHGLRLREDYSLQISYGAVLRTSIFSGPVFTWLRLKSGSILLPTVAHAGAEAAAVTVQTLGAIA